MGPLNNIIMIGSIWLLSVGLGTWLTFFSQPSEIDELRATEQMARIRQSEVAVLLTEELNMEGQASDIQAQWDSRYKTIPKELKTHEVVSYFNGLTRTGFTSFNVAYDNEYPGADFNTHVFRIEGRSTFNALYDFVWAIENYRNFYRITDFQLFHIDLPSVDKETGNERLDMAVSFDFKIHAYFGGAAGLSADDELPGTVAGLTIRPQTQLPPVPASILPDRYPAKNPFYPIIMSQIPPNTRGLLDLDLASLVSIVDGKAVFGFSERTAINAQEHRLVTLGVGDDVYLGRIIMIDPINSMVVARLNIGGIMDERIFQLETANDSYRQAIGPAQLMPSN
ncbi:hypothetical protein JYT20_00975 [Rhodothermus sp. AH-315-K08]|nr:hypothetical protein [Rhodothermus sp. AH-315-K08]